MKTTSKVHVIMCHSLPVAVSVNGAGHAKAQMNKLKAKAERKRHHAHWFVTAVPVLAAKAVIIGDKKALDKVEALIINRSNHKE